MDYSVPSHGIRAQIRTLRTKKARCSEWTYRRPGGLAGFVPPNYVGSLTYDGTNRLTSWGGTSLSYDADVKSDGVRGRDLQLARTEYDDRHERRFINFAYDTLGRRVSSTVSWSTTAYVYDRLIP